MAKLDYTKHSEPMQQGSNAAMAQVGWLGQTGNVYPLDMPLTEIHQQETASYCPLYVQVGTWEWNEEAKRHYVEED
jgi:hypothetical protein